jgi:hypothetical protein
LIDTVAVAEAEDHTGKVGQLEIGLKKNIRVWEKEIFGNVFQLDKWYKGSSDHKSILQ